MFQNRCSHQPRNKDALSFGWREDFQVSFLCGCQKFRWPTFRSAVLAATFRSRLHLSDINFKIRLDFSCFLDLICGAWLWCFWCLTWLSWHSGSSCWLACHHTLGTNSNRSTIIMRLFLIWIEPIWLFQEKYGRQGEPQHSADQQFQRVWPNCQVAVTGTRLWPWTCCHLQQCQCGLFWRTWRKCNALSLQMFVGSCEKKPFLLREPPSERLQAQKEYLRKSAPWLPFFFFDQ